MDRNKSHAIIVGAGPAGMIMAWLLVRNNIQVTIIERHPDFSREFRGEGIQASVMKHLEELGLMDTIMQLKMGVPAEAARVFFNEKPVAVLKGIDEDSDFGIVLHQEKFLLYLHQELSKSSLYQSYLGHTAINFVENNHGVSSITVKDKEKREKQLVGDLIFVTTGRGTALRKKLNLQAKKVATHWNILWILLPRPKQDDLVPKGFRAYLNGESLFILYTNSEGLIQMAWGRKEENKLREKDFEKRKATLLSEIPSNYQTLIKEGYQETSRSQFLKVECDRLSSWHYKNVLFLGDAAHTMSPVAGQGINLAIRDSIVAANHCIPFLKENRPLPSETFIAIQNERIKEIKIMQRFQQKFGYFMLGAPKWQSKIFFFLILPVLKKIGLQKKMLKMVQGGVSKVSIKHLK
ncbi:MAG: NAD(P)-binding protein [Crocinitomicaceae bacterium]|nr:NAD(P)-binding protein [Crocinitomicaceae bacterium]